MGCVALRGSASPAAMRVGPALAFAAVAALYMRDWPGAHSAAPVPAPLRADAPAAADAPHDTVEGAAFGAPPPPPPAGVDARTLSFEYCTA